MATLPVPFDNLAAHPDTGYEGLEAAKDIVRHTIYSPRHQKVWSSSGDVDAVQPDRLISQAIR